MVQASRALCRVVRGAYVSELRPSLRAQHGVHAPHVLHFSVLQPVSAPGLSRDEHTVLEGAVEFTSAYTFSSQSLMLFERLPRGAGAHSSSCRTGLSAEINWRRPGARVHDSA